MRLRISMQKKQRRAGTSSQGVNHRRSRCYVLDCKTLKCHTSSFGFDHRVVPLLAPELTDVISQAVFHITRLVKSLLHHLLDPLLRGRPHDRGEATIPARCDFEVMRQTGHVDEALRVAYCPLVERRDADC